MDGPWNVSFQPNRGAPKKAIFNQLVSYTENKDDNIKYFSGTASYEKAINIPAGNLRKSFQIWIDFGDVKNLAEVIVNGKSLGIIWKKPFRVDVTKVLISGDNEVLVRVTNLWVNRLVGDAQPGITNKITYTTIPFYSANSPLLPSGLLGPVRIIALVK